MKKDLIKIIIAFILFIIAIIIPETNKFIKPAIFIISYVIVGYEVLKEAVENILKGEIFDENFLMAVATIRSICDWRVPRSSRSNVIL